MSSGNNFVIALSWYIETKQEVNELTKLGIQFNDSKTFRRHHNSAIETHRRAAMELSDIIDDIYQRLKCER